MELVFIWLLVKGKNAQECSSFVCENHNVKKDFFLFYMSPLVCLSFVFKLRLCEK